jgi:hypothetical protein
MIAVPWSAQLDDGLLICTFDNDLETTMRNSVQLVGVLAVIWGLIGLQHRADIARLPWTVCIVMMCRFYVTAPHNSSMLSLLPTQPRWW